MLKALIITGIVMFVLFILIIVAISIAFLYPDEEDYDK